MYIHTVPFDLRVTKFGTITHHERCSGVTHWNCSAGAEGMNLSE